MALSMLRHGLQSGRALISSVRLTPAATAVIKKRTIISKQFKEENPDKPKPWPYEKMSFTVWDTFSEDTADRFDENTRLIVIDGNVGVGKSYLAKKLAEELDFFLFPEATMDFKFIDDTGFDLRSISEHFPESLKPYDLERFYSHPKTIMTADFQYSMLALRLEQYIDALVHLFNTGQGVILERSPYSDFVFAEAMHKAGYIDNYDKEVYDKMRRNCREDILRPHVVIYLDAPIDTLLQRIKSRGVPCEQNNKVLTPEYLAEIDRCYKEQYLPSIKDHVEVLSYDWSTFGDPSHVVEDLERLPLDAMLDDRFESKLSDWRGFNDRGWDALRMKYTNEKRRLLVEAIYSVGRYNHPSLNAPYGDVELYNTAWETYYKPKYEKGFNEEDGNSIGLRFETDYRAMQRHEFFRTR
ncbi:NADH dehydrogenase [ubiquinone] 1 alpha subcomplex subunit 10, mitochondrial [Galendromus occidentalis]|uniref:NADH dehydrogenase [ubiquinone] 1 alpha subcomplex subunit 10, mitochondrial n=1 Tax=Galendromus occidentalis TaxID=34638 RepID=A0AAJ6VZN4_9ACAR|nr:NADH dehydrogenase [ubiquinone] 1 alpha subcomplex subunit 10, mitochondrial [Galendromus occidentalis]